MTDKTMDILEANMKARIPIMLVGAPGTGKTAAIRAITEDMGYELITLIGSQMDPTDVRGLPSGQQTGTKEDGTPVFSAEYLSPIFQTQIMMKKRIVLFLDEFSNTPPATRASLLTMLQNREFPNGEQMPKETIIVGAMNPPEEAADGFELDLPTKNRLFFYAWSPSINSWYEGMLNAWGEKCSDKEMLWRRKVVKFIQDQPDQLQKLPKMGGTQEAYGITTNDPSQISVAQSAWASRRSWDNLTKVLAHTDDNDVYVQDMVSKGIVGVEGSFAFREWLRTNDIISPQDALKNPKKVDWESLDLNDTNLLFRSIVEMIDEENALQVMELLKAVLDADRGHLLGPYIKPIMDEINLLTNNKIRNAWKLEFKGMLPRLKPFIKTS